LGDSSRRPQAVAALDPRLGFQLAGAIPLREAAEIAGGHPAVHGVYLRQLRCQSAQSKSSAAACPMGRGEHGRDGRPAHPGDPRAQCRPGRIRPRALGQVDAKGGEAFSPECSVTPIRTIRISRRGPSDETAGLHIHAMPARSDGRAMELLLVTSPPPSHPRHRSSPGCASRG
jgi:hypothetical protein